MIQNTDQKKIYKSDHSLFDAQGMGCTIRKHNFRLHRHGPD